MWNKIKGDYDLAMTIFTKSGNHSSSFTATEMKKTVQLQQGETKDDEKESDDKDEDLDGDPEGVHERGFAHCTQTLPVIY
jgi:hypothetical protein